jgi:transposase
MKATKPKVKKPSPSVLLSVEEVALLRGVSITTVYAWIGAGLAHQKDRWGFYLIKQRDAAAFIAPANGSCGRPRSLTRAQLDFAKTQRADGKTLKEIANELDVAVVTLWRSLKREE